MADDEAPQRLRLVADNTEPKPEAISYEGVDPVGRPVKHTKHVCRPCKCSVLVEAYLSPFVDDYTGKLVPKPKQLVCIKCLRPYFDVPGEDWSD